MDQFPVWNLQHIKIYLSRKNSQVLRSAKGLMDLNFPLPEQIQQKHKKQID